MICIVAVCVAAFLGFRNWWRTRYRPIIAEIERRRWSA